MREITKAVIPAAIGWNVEKKHQKLRVAAYCRVSTLCEEQALSFDTQCEYFKEKITRNPEMELVEVFGDHGCSGTTIGKRPEFSRMLDECMNGRIDYIYVKSISRFARNMADLLVCIEKLKQKGITVFFEQENLESTNKEFCFISSILAALAQEESRDISANIRWSFDKRNSMGFPCHPKLPYGYYKTTDEQGRPIWLVDKEKAKRVRTAYVMTLKGFSSSEVVQTLNQMEKADSSKYVWNTSRLYYRLLKKKTYTGNLITSKYYSLDYLTKKQKRNHGEKPQFLIEGHHEALISEKEYNQVQKVLKERQFFQKRNGISREGNESECRGN